jgi:hypothetical protein
MSKLHVVFLIFLISGSLCAQTNYVEGEIIIQLKKINQLEDVLSKLNEDHPDLGLHLKKVLSRRIGIALLEFNQGQFSPDEVIELTYSFPNVLVSQLNHTNIQKRATIPNDQDYPVQWSLNGSGGGRISAQEAWDIATGDTTALGDEIVFAIVDGGVDTDHVDLKIFKNLYEIPANGVDDDQNGYVDDVNGWNASISNGNIPKDGHGTHVAGIAGAKTDNTFGIAGVMWNASILPIAIDGSLAESMLIEGYAYALEMRALYNESNGDSGAFVVVTNSSFGIDFGQPTNYPIWCAFYDSLGEYGVLNVGATANASWNVDVVGDMPTTCPSDYLLSITNVAQSGTLAGATGPVHVDFGAPGQNIYSTLPYQNYGVQSGTSMATPHAAGVIGLMYSAMCPDDLENLMPYPDSLAMYVRNQLLSFGYDSLGTLVGNTSTGGRINAYKAVLSVKEDSCNEFLSATAHDDTCGLCDGMIELQITGTPPFLISVSPSGVVQGDSLITNLCAGVYTVQVIDSTLNLDSISVEILGSDSLWDSVDVVPTSTPFSSDGAITAYGVDGNPPYNYLWSTGDTTQGISGLPVGTYFVTITDSLGCTLVDSILLLATLVKSNSNATNKPRIWPNPTGSFLNVLYSASPNEPLEIYDLTGRLIHFEYPVNKNLVLDVSNIPSGIYLLKTGPEHIEKIVIRR